MAIHREVAVEDHLPCLTTGFRETQPENYVVQASLQKLQQILTCHSGLFKCLLHVSPELILHNAIHVPSLLLLPELEPMIRNPSTPT
jgi:hypothetical protein